MIKCLGSRESENYFFSPWERNFRKLGLYEWRGCAVLCRVRLCDPMDCSSPGSSVHGILQARILEWVAISFSRGSSWPRDQTHIPCIGRQILSHWATWEAPFLPLHGGGEGDNNSDCTGLLWALAKWPIQCLAYRYSVLGGTICWPFSQRRPFILFRDNLNREWGCPTSNTGQ